MSIESMKQALEALESGDWYIDQLEMIVYSSDDTGTHEERAKLQKAITSLRQAIAEAEKEEPFGFFQYDLRLDAWVQNRNSDKGVAFYTHPQPKAEKQEPVAWIKRDGDVADWGSVECGDIPLYTHPQPKAEKQEPLDNKCPDKGRTEYVCSNRNQCWEPCGELGKSEEHTKIYEQEPKREPLTDKQILTCARNGQHHHSDFRAGVHFAEAAHGII